MAQDELQHKHSKDDIIIKDQDGTYKILRDGKFVPLDEVESAEAAAMHAKDAGPKRAPDEQHKPVPSFAKEKVEAPKMQAASQPAPEGQPKQDYTKKAEEVIAKSNVTFASMEIRQRVVLALVAHLKGVRKPFETREQLMKNAMEGGAGLSKEDAERLMGALAGQRFELRPPMDISKTVSPQNEVVPPMMGKRPVGQEVHEAYPIQAAMQKPTEVQPQPRPIPPKPAVAPKTSVMDVKKPLRPTVGLAGELAYSLADWRRVAPAPRDRMKKIETQLDVLEEEGMPERLKGWQAWRESDVMQLYKDAGRQSLEEGKPLTELLGGGSPEGLSWEEWQAVADFNASMRF